MYCVPLTPMLKHYKVSYYLGHDNSHVMTDYYYLHCFKAKVVRSHVTHNKDFKITDDEGPSGLWSFSESGTLFFQQFPNEIAYFECFQIVGRFLIVR